MADVRMKVATILQGYFDMETPKQLIDDLTAILSADTAPPPAEGDMCPPSASPHRESSMAGAASRYVAPPKGE